MSYEAFNDLMQAQEDASWVTSAPDRLRDNVELARSQGRMSFGTSTVTHADLAAWLKAYDEREPGTASLVKLPSGRRAIVSDRHLAIDIG